ncbi:hypothetical protein [Embleya hyalina]|uniref:Secreted protein n=1 Tax=Embleya hyalina TaxID=516124 RepID=A0A401YZR9_9ACTN|nr:hypothetical protein [Embleya hyalina]GCE00107.1 hypothetical protein EHYA_07832 [Embleya hyalina]
MATFGSAGRSPRRIGARTFATLVALLATGAATLGTAGAAPARTTRAGEVFQCEQVRLLPPNAVSAQACDTDYVGAVSDFVVDGLVGGAWHCASGQVDASHRIRGFGCSRV